MRRLTETIGFFSHVTNRQGKKSKNIMLEGGSGKESTIRRGGKAVGPLLSTDQRRL